MCKRATSEPRLEKLREKIGGKNKKAVRAFRGALQKTKFRSDRSISLRLAM